MSKADYEAYLVVIGRRHGKRYADRRRLVVPVALATGRYEALSELQLREALNDLTAETQRRSDPALAPTIQYDPLKSQIRRPHASERN